MRVLSTRCGANGDVMYELDGRGEKKVVYGE